MLNHKKIKSGFAAVVVVVIVGAAALTIALSTALLGVRELEIATTADRGVLTKTFADGCLDMALLTLRLNSAPVNSDFTDSVGRCIITMSGIGGGKIQITIQGIIDGNSRSLIATVTPTPANHSIVVNSYAF